MHKPSIALRIGASIGFGVVLAQAVVPVAAATPDAGAGLTYTSCPAGSQLYLPVSSSLEADGWIDLRYDVGTEVDVEVPPPGFDIVTAPDSAVASHNVRPLRDAMRQAGPEVGHSAPRTRTRGLCVDHTMFNSVTTKSNPAWAGSEVKAASTYSLNGVEAWYVQPTPAFTTSCASPRVSSWVGLGGDPRSVALVQVGSIAWAPPSLKYAPFWEWIDGSGVDQGTFYFDGFPAKGGVSGGDKMFAYVFYSSSSASVEVVDSTTGYWDSSTVKMGSWNPEATAEWIDERQGGGTDLANYGKSSWSSMKVSRTNANAWTAAYSEPSQIKWNIVTADTVATSSGISSSNTMSTIWSHCA